MLKWLAAELIGEVGKINITIENYKFLIDIRIPVDIHGQPLMFTRRGQLEEEHFRQMKDAWQ
jgi:hypothetical protein